VWPSDAALTALRGHRRLTERRLERHAPAPQLERMMSLRLVLTSSAKPSSPTEGDRLRLVHLCTVLDDFYGYIIAWQLRTTMATSDRTDTLQPVLTPSGCDRVRVHTAYRQSTPPQRIQPRHLVGSLRFWCGDLDDFVYPRTLCRAPGVQITQASRIASAFERRCRADLRPARFRSTVRHRSSAASIWVVAGGTPSSPS
jgi:transposase InsO family protein